MLLHLLNFHRKRLWEYRLEILAGALRMTVQISVLLLFWSIVGKSATSGILTSDLIAYFLVANGMNELTMAMNLRLCGTIQDGIKSGELSRYILRPVRLLPFLVTETFGRYLVLNSFAILFIGLGMVLKPPTQLGLLLFAPALLCSLAISFAINLLVGIIAFYTVEARSLRWVANFPIQFLSGVVIPLSFFPPLWREVMIRSPFPGLIAGPVLALQATTITTELATLLTWSLLWAIALPLVSLAIWTRSLRNYEAVGL